MIRKLATALLSIAALVPIVGQAAPRTQMTHHVRDVVLNGQAKLVGQLPATQSMRLVLVLPHRNEEALQSFLQSLYDPASPTYRQFLTVAEFTSAYGPAQEDYDSVVSFANTHGLSVVGTSINRMNVDVAGTVANIQAAFHVTMGVYRHPTENRTFYSPDREPTTDLPFALWHIAGMDNYSIPKPALVKNPGVKSNTTGSCLDGSFCGSDMRAAYYEGTSLTGAGQTLGLLEYAGADLTDLDTYYTNVHQTNNVPITLISTDGTPTKCVYPSCDDLEQTIDMTQSLGMAPGLAGLYMYVGSTDTAIFNAMATHSPLNAQLSCSWYWSPADPNTLNPIFEEFAAQGQNLFDAAGDYGAWGGSIWPADNAYLTSVGGTDLTTTGPGGAWKSETVWEDGGGGISPNDIPIPAWQEVTAAGCINPCSTKYRNAPDVTGNANWTYYVCADQEACTANEWGGTSFAAPMWAGYLALANQQEVANGGKPLGFINYALYAIGLGANYGVNFHDITVGTNGYAATVGYDLASGWGSMNGAALLNTLTGGAGPSFTLSASPASITVAPGSGGTSTITTTVSGGFDAAITLTASGTGSSIAVTFNPATIAAPGAGTSTMEVHVGKNTKAGTRTITITATGGGKTETTTVTLDVS